MSYNYDLTKISAIDDNRQQDVYRFNLALNHALLSGDSAVVRRFYQQTASKVGAIDIFKFREIDRSFFRNSPAENAFTYAGVIPWIVESVVRLVASSGFKVKSKLKSTQAQSVDFEQNLEYSQLDVEQNNSDKQQTSIENTSNADTQPVDFDQYQDDLDEYAEYISDSIKLQSLFERGVYLEAGLGDLLYRISYDSEISDSPIVDIVEPQNFEIKYKRGHISEIVIKDSSDEVGSNETSIKSKRIIEMHETYSKDLSNKDRPNIKIAYSFWTNRKEIQKGNPLYESCKQHWGIGDTTIKLPFKDFPLVYKQNTKPSMLYKGERGVPDIHGLDTIEDSLSESLSQLIDAIRTATPKTIIDESMLGSDEKGNTLKFNEFDKRYIILKGADSINGLLNTVSAKIEYQSFIETFRALVSHACNKAGLSPTTLGVTGLESINSSVESQDAREKPSLRTREIKHTSWKPCLEELLNKYFQYVAYLNNEQVLDYSDMLDITFNAYINPSTESVLSTIGQAVASRVYSVEIGVEKVFEQEGKSYTLDDIVAESARIKGITPVQEMQVLGLLPMDTGGSQGYDNVDITEQADDSVDNIDKENNLEKGDGNNDNAE